MIVKKISAYNTQNNRYEAVEFPDKPNQLYINIKGKVYWIAGCYNPAVQTFDFVPNSDSAKFNGKLKKVIELPEFLNEPQVGLRIVGYQVDEKGDLIMDNIGGRGVDTSPIKSIEFREIRPKTPIKGIESKIE